MQKHPFVNLFAELYLDKQSTKEREGFELKLICRKITALILLVSLISFFDISSHCYAADALHGVTDLVSIYAPGATVKHIISFHLPEGTNPAIETTDYIIVDMDQYDDVSAPTYVTGPYTGTPVYSQVGKRLYITGIGLQPGQNLSILGIIAKSPDVAEAMFSRIIIATDFSASDIKYEQGVATARQTNRVTMTAAKPGEVGTLIISGLTSPGMFLTFIEGGNIIGSNLASEDGTFTNSFPGLPSGEHTIVIYGSDLDNHITPGVYLENLFMVTQTTVSVSNVLIPPTISIDKEEIQQGETINVLGRGAPDHTSIVFTEPPLQSHEALTDSSGIYQYSIEDTIDFEYGDHKVYALLQNELGAQSRQSIMLFFRVGSAGDPGDNGGEQCSIIRGNLDCDADNQVNLTDFSILLYYWGSGSASSDINGDGVVNLIDFSIMMFYWNG